MELNFHEDLYKECLLSSKFLVVNSTTPFPQEEKYDRLVFTLT